MKNIPANLILEKNKLATGSAWLILLQITFSDNTILYLVRNNENITFQDNEYIAFPFELGDIKESSKGEIPSLSIKISNVTKAIQYYLEQFNGAIGSQIKIIVVNSSYLSEDYSELELDYEVTGASSNAQWVEFTLGIPNPLRKRFPLHRFIAEHCNWRFKSAECAYSGVEFTTCDRTLKACRARDNTSRFGGFLGLSNIGVRLV